MEARIVNATATAGTPVGPLLRINGVVKNFPGVKALDNVDLEVRCGEVHALLGENGAGKSTMVKIIAGEYEPDGGTLFFDGREVTMRSPAHADELGIGLIHQHFPLAPNLSAGENIFMNREPVRGMLRNIDFERLHSDARALLAQLGLDIDTRTPVGQLAVAQRQMVEIAKALSRHVKLMIMDEPTSALGEEEVERLFDVIDQLRRAGVAVIYVSHKLDEVFRIADRITVLRDGRVVGTQLVGQTDQGEVIRMMVGRTIGEMYPYVGGEPGRLLFEARGLVYKKALHGVSLSVAAGEVLGITGLIGSGLTELAGCIFGLLRPDTGEIRLEGKVVDCSSPVRSIAAGIMLVPQDRGRTGLCQGLSVRHNISLPNLAALSRYGFVLPNEENQMVAVGQSRLKIICSSLDMTVRNLSGGNQQKVVLAKWLAGHPRLLVLDSPTVGIDVGSKVEIYRLLTGLARQEKIAILLLSQELPEILGVTDRIIVLREGQVVGHFRRDEATAEALRRCAGGLETHLPAAEDVQT